MRNSKTISTRVISSVLIKYNAEEDYALLARGTGEEEKAKAYRINITDDLTAGLFD